MAGAGADALKETAGGGYEHPFIRRLEEIEGKETRTANKAYKREERKEDHDIMEMLQRYEEYCRLNPQLLNETLSLEKPDLRPRSKSARAPQQRFMKSLRNGDRSAHRDERNRRDAHGAKVEMKTTRKCISRIKRTYKGRKGKNKRRETIDEF